MCEMKLIENNKVTALDIAKTMKLDKNEETLLYNMIICELNKVALSAFQLGKEHALIEQNIDKTVQCLNEVKEYAEGFKDVQEKKTKEIIEIIDKARAERIREITSNGNSMFKAFMQHRINELDILKSELFNPSTNREEAEL